MLFVYDGVECFEKFADLQTRLEKLNNERNRISEIIKKSRLQNHEKKNCRASLFRLSSEIEKINLRLRSMAESL